MVSRIRARLSYANVVATIALFIALGGGAYAAIHLPRNSVSSRNIRNGQVKGADVKESSLAKVPKAKQADKTHGLSTYRISAELDESDNRVTLWRHGPFRLKASCLGPASSTQAAALIGASQENVDYSSVLGGQTFLNPTVYANDGADADDYGPVALVNATNQFPTVGNGSFGATLPGANGKPAKTVTGNIVVLARHHAAGKDCSINGEVSAGY